MRRLAILSEDLTAVLAPYPASDDDVGAVYPKLRLGTELRDDSLAQWPRVVLVHDSPAPEVVFGERAVEVDPVKDGSTWRQAWTIQTLTLPQARTQLRAMARDVILDRVEVISPLELQLFSEVGRLEMAQAAGLTIVQSQYPLIQSVAAKRSISFANAATLVNTLRGPWLNRADNFSGSFVDVIDRIQSAADIAAAHAIYLELEAIP